MGSLTPARAVALAAMLSLVACAGPPNGPVEKPIASPPTGSTTASSSPTPEPAGETREAYQASVRRIGPDTARRMSFSHRSGCPVPLADLRLLRMRYVDYEGTTRTGELVVHQDHARAVTGVFKELYDARWRVARMRLVDAYRGDDDLSMAANNTSAYNCRRVAGSPDWSEHAYGAAIDINPVENPYVTDEQVVPPAGRPFAGIDRSRGVAAARGVIVAGDVVVRAFARIGWKWGGEWSTAKDYQHFSASGR